MNSVPLSDLPTGATGRVHRSDLEAGVAGLLRALGLTRTAEFRVCKSGEPCIIQVRSTRIGLSRGVAQQIFVLPTSARGEQP